MPTQYRIYRNAGDGGPVDYSSPIATVADTSYEVGPLAVPGDHSFAVRAFDPASGLEEANSEALTRVVLDGSGREIGVRPRAPHALAARPLAGGCCRVSWAYAPRGFGPTPLGFQVYLTPGTLVDYGVPATIVAYRAGQLGYTAVLNGLTHGTLYTVAVRAFVGATSDENRDFVLVEGDGRAPDAVDSLTGTTTRGR